MKLKKFRGKNADFINSLLENENLDMFVGTDRNGKEIYENDLVVDEKGEVYKVVVSASTEYVSQTARFFEFELKEN